MPSASVSRKWHIPRPKGRRKFPQTDICSLLHAADVIPFRKDEDDHNTFIGHLGVPGLLVAGAFVLHETLVTFEQMSAEFSRGSVGGTAIRRMSMSVCKREMKSLNVFVVLLVIGFDAEMARAEFKVGERLPTVSLQATEGIQIDLVSKDGALILKQSTTESKPAAVVVQLLQPDCLQCRAQLKELQALSDRYQPRGVAILGISHRGDMKQLEQLGKDLVIKFPLLHGVGSDIAKQFAAGDTLGIVDKSGVIRFAQVGYGKGDEKLWSTALEELLGRKELTETTTSRERLAVGDRFPAVELPSIQNGKPLALVGKDGRLTFRDDQGKETQPKAAVGFFSRY